MSEVKIVIKADTAQAVSAVDATGQALDGLGSAGKKAVVDGFAPLAPAVNAAGKQVDKFGVSIGQTRQAIAQLPAQLHQAADQLMSGGSPFTVLFQQGGQVIDSFGGIRPAAAALVGALSPVAIAVAGVAAVAGTLALAIFQGRSEAQEFAKALLLTGNYAGTTASQFSAQAQAISASTGATVGNVRELGIAAVGTGAFGAQSIGSVTAAMARLQSISGASAQDVVTDFAGMSRGVAAWAAAHNLQYAFITKATYDQIKALEQQGNVEKAMALTADSFNATLAARQPQLGNLEKAWKAVGETASKAWQAMMNWGKPEDMGDKLAKLQAGLERAKTAPASDRFYDAMGNQVAGRAAAVASWQAAVDAVSSDVRQQGSAEQALAARAAAERTNVGDDASGATDRLSNAAADLSLARARNAAAAQLAVLDAQQQALDQAHAIGLVHEQEYADAKAAILAQELEQKVAGIQREIAIERARPVGGKTETEHKAAATAQAAKIAGLEGQRQAIVADSVKQISAIRADAALKDLEVQRDALMKWRDAYLGAMADVRQAQKDNRQGVVDLIQDPEQRARQQAALDIEQMRQQAMAKIGPLQDAINANTPGVDNSALQAQADALGDALNQSIAIRQARLAQELKPGWQAMLDGWGDTTKNMKDGFNAAMDGILHNAEDAWVQLVTTGKVSVKGLVTSVMAELARADFKNFISGAGGSLLGSVASGIGWLFGISGGRAAGGGVDAGSTYLVGERGPELLRMGAQGGTVIPNHALAAAAGAAGMGGGISIRMSPNIRIDARSDAGQVAQLVAAGMAQARKDVFAELRGRGLIR